MKGLRFLVRPSDVSVSCPVKNSVLSTHLLRLDLVAGGTDDVIDLGPFPDADGIPDPADMALYEGPLFLLIRRWNQDFLAVIDVADHR